MAEERKQCFECGADIISVNGEWRHANKPWEDQSTFCSKYGYPTWPKELTQ